MRRIKHIALPVARALNAGARMGKCLAIHAKLHPYWEASFCNIEPIGIAGLWSSWKGPKGEWVHNFTTPTINADALPLMNQFHKPNDEKCMVAILMPERYQGWLEGYGDVAEFMLHFDADLLQASPEIRRPSKPAPLSQHAPL